MIIGAMQSHFMPGIGYFALMKNVDQFVILDDVQFEKRGWQQRNYFFLNKKKNFLTVPVLSKGLFHQKINKVKISKESNFVSKHLRTIEQNYKKTNFFDDIFPDLEKIYSKNHIFLKDLNYDLIIFFKQYLGIKTKLVMSSTLNVFGVKEKRIDEICKKLKCKKYFATIGSKEYLDNLSNLDYEIVYYKILYKNKDPQPHINLCMLDLIFNIGKLAKNHIDENFKLIT